MSSELWNAKRPQPFKLIQYHLAVSQPLSTVPDEVCAEVHGILIVRHYLTADDLVRFPKLRCVVRTGVGYDRLDRKALAAAGVKVANVPDYGTTEVADHALAMALSLRRGIILQHDAQRLPGAEWKPLNGPPGIPLSGPIVHRPTGKTWACLGLGRIGIAAALRAKTFGYRVVFYDPFLPNGLDRALGITRLFSLTELFSQADVISLHCAHTPETHLVVNDTTLALLPPGAILINVSRGECVSLDAVERALRRGRLTAAGLDVLETEPIVDPPPPLIQAYRASEPWLMGRLIITPHCAFFSDEAVRDIQIKSTETMRDILFDNLDTNVIDPSSW
ncbi:hypothetical protein BD324DRAFT_643977 [Kockovaella imperatae]|uniref:C-terminal binding protein n=1 Tax=Kockovaella imperatae TaxID=4999 RepID=A0A1Y1U5I8_9TREE|nr:hypothetical protein BD324DRAFT_643977 [Kockovaella imperatae]ORX33301.1 hypothetical protein BD324DRAFT_643977 [Kockovaella imperatae]